MLFERRCNSHPVSNPLVAGTKEHSASDHHDSTFNDHEPKYLLQQGRKPYRIKADGNCMYRAISYSISNDEENHSSIRLLLQRFENLNKDLLRRVLTSINKPTIEQHITHMGIPSTWGTHVELFAIATYYQVPVHTYVAEDTDPRWKVFKPLSTTKCLHYPITTGDDDSITPFGHTELLYYPNSHYDSIVDCTTGKCSTTEPPLHYYSSLGDSSVTEV